MIVKNRRAVFTVIGLVFAGLVVWFFCIQLSRIGKVTVTIETSPKGALVKINGKPGNTGTNYLPKGTYTFTAEKKGYEKAEQTVTIRSTDSYIALLPTPLSEDAIKEANSPAESSWAETISGIASGRSGEALQGDNPIVRKLPYSDIGGPFKIDYGYNQGNNNKIYLIVSYASPNGRNRAISWLRKNNVNITRTEIVFQDFKNPTITGEESHD